MTIPDALDCRHTDDPVCPYCGAEQGDFWEVSSDSGEQECGSCGRPFFFEREVSVTYSTSPLMGPHQQSEFMQEYELEQEEERG